MRARLRRQRWSLFSLTWMLTCVPIEVSQFLVWGYRNMKDADVNQSGCDASTLNYSLTSAISPRLEEVNILRRWNGVIDGSIEVKKIGAEGALNQGLFIVTLLPWCTPGKPENIRTTAVVKGVGESEQSELEVHEKLSVRNHPNIMPIYDKVAMGESLGVMMANAGGGTLFKMFPRETHFTDLEHFSDDPDFKFVTAKTKSKRKDTNLLKLHISRVALDFSRGLTSMHHKEVGYVHCDLKPENVMASSKGCLPQSLEPSDVKETEENKCVFMLIDFGLTHHSSDGDQLSECFGTAGYYPPEANCFGNSADRRYQHKVSWDLIGSKYQSGVKPMGWSKEGDLYAMGLTILSAVTGLWPDEMMFEYGKVTVQDSKGDPVTIISVTKISIESKSEDVTDLVDAKGQLAVVLKDVLHAEGSPACEDVVEALHGLETEPPNCEQFSRQYVKAWFEAQKMKPRNFTNKFGASLKNSMMKRKCGELEEHFEKLLGYVDLNCHTGTAQYTIDWAIMKVANILNIPVRELSIRHDSEDMVKSFHRIRPKEIPIFKWLGDDMKTFLQRALALKPRDRLNAFALSSIATKAYKNVLGRTKKDPDPRFEREPTPACIKDCSACNERLQCHVQDHKVSCEGEGKRKAKGTEGAPKAKRAKKEKG
eukprot:TRINITY_DN23554_c0_g3_i1.p1 TRINITY_DN23554_c0_g3~~TRINITY_DN23554_c0_g3_i1.p1  ORF type:complete len:651 (-),score=70.67 TRINITY_DN23554_c0_g3_i1:137-2089(-)